MKRIIIGSLVMLGSTLLMFFGFLCLFVSKLI